LSIVHTSFPYCSLEDVLRSHQWQGMCENVLDLDLQAFEPDEHPTLVIRDLKKSAEYANWTYVKEKNAHFYAGAPLISPAGAIVGSLCILDGAPRPDGLSKVHRHSLRDMAQSIMDYLHTYTIKDQLWRGERFTRGLVSFSEGAEHLLPFKNANEEASESTPEHIPASSEALASPFDEKNDPLGNFRETRVSSEKASLRSKSIRQRNMENLQENILPMDARSMFSRAANVMMASSDLDGVVIFDASIAANERRRRSRSREANSTETGTGAEDTGEYQSLTSSSDGGGSNRAESMERSSSKHAKVLGSATKDANGNDRTEFGLLLEADLSRMLRDYPKGKVITFDMNGLALSSTDESSASDGSTSKDSILDTPKRRSKGSSVEKHSRAIQAMLTGARSVAFVPFWDYERSRWFAGCLCWSNRPHRLLSEAVDLAYYKIFSHSVMRELSRLDALASNHSKTTFVASISHELRSPLHGILGTLEFIKDTSLDSFQTSMFNSLNSCGRTLLDTINHLMDYAQINETTKNVSFRRLKSKNTVRLSSKPVKKRRSRAGAFDLSIATEEVIEAVFSGSTYVSMVDTASSPTRSESDQISNRKMCYIVFDIAQADNWMYCFPAGSWRRIVMNLFGNAIKYTETGHIHVSLRANNTTVTLTVTDSGIGMSPGFLANRAFQPFSQEDSVCH
jgi:signal transduction histidine kinase